MSEAAKLVDGDPITRPSHYTKGGIEPIKFIIANGLDFLEGNVVKYVVRYKHKNGVEDLRKARQYLDWLIEREYPTKAAGIENSVILEEDE